MMPVNPQELVRSTEAAWDRVAAKYEAEFEHDVALLRGGGDALMEHERRLLGDLSQCQLAVHLQCSHGLDALSLLNRGVHEIIGIDLSREMLALAARKAEAVGARARWVHAEVLSLPSELDACADLVYTGKGALPWVSDLGLWATGVARVLCRGGRFFMHEGHPLNFLWDALLPQHVLHADGRGYFDRQPRANDDFPARAVEAFTPAGQSAPAAWEYQWTVGQVVTALCEAGLIVEHLEEHPEHFWPQLRAMPENELARLPHTYSVIARRPAA
jgi:ubiquinone/menaquinone biosynthesis C-methylase UbiE